MITLGYIYDRAKLQEGYKKSIQINDYQYWVYLPTLTGQPDSKTEHELFSAYEEYLSKKDEVKQNLSTLQKFIFALKGKKTISEVSEPTDYQKQFLCLASVCSLAGSKVVYNTGDAVVVGFLDNSLSKPIILGSYLTPGNEQITISRPQIKAQSIVVDDKMDETCNVVLPNNTTLGDMTVDDIKQALTFVNSLENMGFGLEGFIKLLNVISNITKLLPGMPNIFNLNIDSDEENEEEE